MLTGDGLINGKDVWVRANAVIFRESVLGNVAVIGAGAM
jgi:acetyltransferase-like isoleucine patch superfamily enzyme